MTEGKVEKVQSQGERLVHDFSSVMNTARYKDINSNSASPKNSKVMNFSSPH